MKRNMFLIAKAAAPRDKNAASARQETEYFPARKSKPAARCEATGW
jgi:hypothetical protein